MAIMNLQPLHGIVSALVLVLSSPGWLVTGALKLLLVVSDSLEAWLAMV